MVPERTDRAQMRPAGAAGVGKDIVDRSQQDPSLPEWLLTLVTIAHAYVNSEIEEQTAAEAFLTRIACSDSLRQAAPAVRLLARDTIAQAHFARNMRTDEAAALDSAVTVGLDMADDARAHFGVASRQAAAAMTAAGYYLAHRALDRDDPADTERAMALLREAQDTRAVPPSKRFQMLTGLGIAQRARYVRSQDIQDLDQCISMWDAAKDELPEDPSDRPGHLRNLAIALEDRFAISGDHADIGRAVELLEQAVDAAAPASPQLMGRRQALQRVLKTHFDATGQRRDLDKMADLLETMAQDAPPDLRRLYQTQLARVLDQKLTYFGGSLPTWHRAVEIAEAVLADTPADDPARPAYQDQLAIALHQLAEQTGDLQQTERAVALASAALEATREDAPEWAAYARNLAVILRGRARKTSSREDVDQAIRLLEQIDMNSLAGPDAYVPRVSLGNALLLRFQLRRGLEDLDKAVATMEDAVACTMPQTPQRRVALRNLTAALQVRHAVTADPGDLERLASLHQERARAGDPAAGPRDASTLIEEYELTGDLGTLDAAIAEMTTTLATSAGSAEYHDSLLQLGQALWKKYEHTGDIDLLNRAIEIYENILAEAPAESPARSWALARLAASLRDRYVRTAAAADLDRAIATYQTALEAPGASQMLKVEVYGNLGLALWDRYGSTGGLRDLDNVIAAIQARASLAPGHERHDETALNTLGLALRDRFLLSGNPDDLAEAVRAHQEALALSAPSSPYRSSRLNNLAGTYYHRWLYTNALPDLDRAIDLFEQAIEVGPPGQDNRLRALANLAVCLRNRYIRKRDAEDLGRAVAVAETAVAETPADSAEYPHVISALADTLRTRYDQIGRHADLQRAAQAYRDCCTRTQYTRAYGVLTAAMAWCRWASRRGAWCEAAEAGELAMSAMIRLFQNQYGRPHKEAWLAASRGAPVLAAYALAMAGESARAAVALESGRALLLSEALRQDRADLDALQATGHGSLTDRYLEAAERWTRLLAMAGQAPDSPPQPSGTAPLLPASTAGASAETSRFMTSWQHDAQLKAARAALDAAIEAIHGIPGHEQFLRSPGIEDIRAAAASPLVYLVAAEHGGMALIVRAPASGNHDREGPHVVPLPDLTTGEVSDWTRTLREAHQRRDDQPAWHGVLDALTARLWTAAMGPVIEALGGAETAVLIPAGQLVTLPLHAAWTTDTTLPGGRRYALDDVCLSYAPNAVSLSAAAGVAASAAADSLLLVEEPRPSTREPLPFARAEAAAAAAPFRHIRALRHENATVSAVLGALDGRNVQHFTCHAIADLASPLDSALILAGDEPLTLREILEQHPGRPGRTALRLAVLAACETQVPGRQLPDEVISLPAGLIQAGAAGVIASQWAVPGLATAMLMTRFYHCWKHDQLPPAAALRAAQHWLRDTTNGEKADYFEAAVRDESGPVSDSARTLWRAMARKAPGDRAHAHISEWAAFVHTGA
jgi:CHAT domain-containing protein